MKRLASYVLFAAVLLVPVDAARAQSLTVSLVPTVASPAPVGTTVKWTVAVSGNSGNLRYRFRVRPAGMPFHVVRDFSPEPTLGWTAAQHEGLYEIEAAVRDTATGATGVATASYRMTSLAAEAPVITPTQNSLVFLYSAPPCAPPGRMRVAFESPDGVIQSTPYQDCQAGLSMNFYLAGMRANTTYSVHHVIESRQVRRGEPVSPPTEGPPLSVTTGAVPVQLPVATILQPPPAPPGDQVVLYSNLFGPPFATDPQGNVIWYYPANLTLLTRPESGGRFLAVVATQPITGFGQILREIDVAGNTLRETDTTQINAQLAALGKPAIGVFHHDAIGLPNGEVAVLATTEQIMNGVQGPGPVDIIGDMILVLDRDFQVVWTWDAFDHLDPHRQATLGETCPGLGCPPLSLASHANDWLHGNALIFAADGNLLYSSRHQDWIIKIDFRGGQGTGDVIWRLGKDGDFLIESNDPSPWFSHQHGPRLSPEDGTLLAVFDDSNLRQRADSNAHSRGQVLRLDEQNHIATLVIDDDLGGFSFALGNAQPLRNGGYLFDVGWLPDNSSRLVVVDGSGNPLETVRMSAPEYRNFRMRDMYTRDSDRVIRPALRELAGQMPPQ
ncbi:MAG: aryl-sulfate sulfotransferase [Acidobacteria bacterium]|nr:aryl-sulfate sulfotransferase [Acidobacteriota bacterium]